MKGIYRNGNSWRPNQDEEGWPSEVPEVNDESAEDEEAEFV
jgi:hypothetical protein